MKQPVLSLITAAGFVALLVSIEGPAQTQAQQREQVRARTGQREIIPGSELMSSKEREQYRRRMAAAASDADRAKLRAEHVKAMQERARVRGLQLAEPAGGQK